jgi:hypothetical protein
MYSWVVKKALLRHLRMRMEALLVFVLLASFLLTMIPTVQNDFGAVPGVTCWLATLSLTNLSVIMNKARPHAQAFPSVLMLRAHA